MKIHKTLAGPMALTLLMGGYLLVPSAANAKPGEIVDNAEINRLFVEVATQASALKTDATEMETFTRTDLNWESYAEKIAGIKEHVNAAGKLLAKLEDVKAQGAPWQQTAIDRIAPLLREMASNTTATINYMNENKMRVHLAAFKDYVKTSYELAINLEAVIRNFVEYGNSKDKFENLDRALEISGGF